MEIEELKRQKETAEQNLSRLYTIWEKAVVEFKTLKDKFQIEIAAHEKTKQRLEDEQKLFETLTRVASAGLEEFNTLKKEYAKEHTIRKAYEVRFKEIAEKNPTLQIPAIYVSDESVEEATMKGNLSDYYLVPTLTDLGDRIGQLEEELQESVKRAETAEKNLERVQGAASLALQEFQNLKSQYSKETLARQEAEKLALQYQVKLDSLGNKLPGSKPESGNIEELKDMIETERRLRLLSEEEVNQLTRKLSERSGKEFDLVTITELECRLEDLQRSLNTSNERLAKTEDEKYQLQQQVEELKSRVGDGGPPPPAPPPPPPILAVNASENLKKRVGDLKKKLQGTESDPLNDLRAQAMLELQEKLKKRSQKTSQTKTPEPEKKEIQSTSMSNLASVLERTKTQKASLQKPQEKKPETNKTIEPKVEAKQESKPESQPVLMRQKTSDVDAFHRETLKDLDMAFEEIEKQFGSMMPKN